MNKIKYACLIIIVFMLAPLGGFCLETMTRTHFPNYSPSQYSESHVFHDKSGNELGRVLVRYRSGDIFTSLVVTQKNNGKGATLYFVDGNKFIGQSGIEMEAYAPGFYGYRIVLKKDDYIVLSYLRNEGKSVSDDVTIEWNYDRRVFQVMKGP